MSLTTSPCYTCGLSDNWNLTTILSWLNNDQIQVVTNVRDVLYYQTVAQKGWLFVFGFGAVVGWGVDFEDFQQLVKSFSQISGDQIANPPIDKYRFFVGKSFKVENDIFELPSDDPNLLLSLSYALAQSAKLEIFETRVQEVVRSTLHIIDQLSQTGRITLRRHQLAKQIGWLMQQRFSINLHCDILDIPDFFWERNNDLERFYRLAANYLDLEQRVDVLERRLDTANDIFHLLTIDSNHRHSAFMETIVIVLISSEIVISILSHFGHLLH